MILGRQLAALREKAGLSYEQAAEVIYTSAATVRRIDATEEEVTRRVELRLARQHIPDRPDPPRLWLVIDEAALRRPAASTGPQVIRAQLDALAGAAARPNVTLQVLPFTAGFHPAMYGPFRIFRFEGQDQPDIAYGETMTSAFYIDKPDETALYAQALDRASAQATPADAWKPRSSPAAGSPCASPATPTAPR
jgi:hypothetical protein